MGTTTPSFLCPAAEAAGAEEGSTAVDGSTNYVVRSVDPDGTGLVRIRLELQP
jgi:hypothetical protein